jgi:hypothetical protein
LYSQSFMDSRNPCYCASCCNHPDTHHELFISLSLYYNSASGLQRVCRCGQLGDMSRYREVPCSQHKLQFRPRMWCVLPNGRRLQLGDMSRRREVPCSQHKLQFRPRMWCVLPNCRRLQLGDVSRYREVPWAQHKIQFRPRMWCVLPNCRRLQMGDVSRHREVPCSQHKLQFRPRMWCVLSNCRRLQLAHFKPMIVVTGADSVYIFILRLAFGIIL